MPQMPHVEKHFTASEYVRDIVIGMSDGLTVPFALAAGLIAISTGLKDVSKLSVPIEVGSRLLRCYDELGNG